jgi:N-acyl-D-aspartate/D-glutamate deacylase
MSVEALTAGIDWSFETFPQYLDAVDRGAKRLNVAALIGHTPLRLYVLGEDATERSATDDEVAQMKAIVREAVDAGAIGFATSKSPTHSGAGGRPVPSRMAEVDEVTRIAAALGEAGRGVVQVTPGRGLFVDELAALSEAIDRPVTWTALLTGMFGTPRGRAVENLERQKALAGEVWPQIACRPLVMQMNLADPFPLAMLPTFKEILALPREKRAELYADPAWRDRARAEVGPRWEPLWPKTTVQESTKHEELRGGPSVAELAAQRGVDPFDVVVDLSLDEDLATRFRVVLANDDEVELAALLRDDRAVLGLSDAGAHASQLCDANFSTHLLGHWVREEGVLTLEQAVRRLTSHAANVFRLPDRGSVQPGAWADLVAFDPDTVSAGELERVWDLPAGADRLIAHPTGIEHVWVNGVATRRDSTDLDARPGALIRGGTA